MPTLTGPPCPPPPRADVLPLPVWHAHSKPLGLPPKEPLPERWRAKQFATAPPRSGKTLDAFFECKHAYLAEVREVEQLLHAH